MMNKIYLTESQINAIVSESVKRIMLDEGLWDNIKAGYRGMKQGFQNQQTLDRGADNFKPEHDYENFRAMANPYTKNPENTAIEQARSIYQQYCQHRQMASKLERLLNKMCKQYNLTRDRNGNITKMSKTPQSAPLADTNKTAADLNAKRKSLDNRRDTNASNMGLGKTANF